LLRSHASLRLPPIRGPVGFTHSVHGLGLSSDLQRPTWPAAVFLRVPHCSSNPAHTNSTTLALPHCPCLSSDICFPCGAIPTIILACSSREGRLAIRDNSLRPLPVPR